MIITDSVLRTLMTSLKHEFQQQLTALEAHDIYKTIATIINSSSRSNTYGWLGKFPQLREWIGDRIFEDIKSSSYVIENKKYEATLNVERVDIEDDNIGVYRPLARSMADEVVAFYNRNIAALLKGGFDNPCYDGFPFFSSTHPVYARADGTGAAADVSNILGDPGSAGSSWFLLSLAGTLRPVILQQRTAPEFEEITDTKNNTVFIKDQYLYGVRYRGSFGYGFWQQAVASKEELSAENYEAARLQMRQFKRDGGDPLGIVPTHLVVSADNESAARKILEAQLIDGGDSNVNYHTAELVVSPWL